MMRKMWLAAAFSILTLQPVAGQEIPSGIPEDLGMSSQRLQALTDLLQGYTDGGMLPGAVVSITRRGQIVHE